MKITVDLDTLGENGKGEALRGLVFDQRDGETGCYSTFDVNEGFEKIDPAKYPDIYKFIKPEGDGEYTPVVVAYESKDIVVMWVWDGDGYLLIWIKGEPYAYQNTDCKCDYTWNEVELSPIADSRDRTGVQ